MSAAGCGCRCSGLMTARKANWVIHVYRANYSAFNGYRCTPSDYSEVGCTACGARWRTKAGYVNQLPVCGGLGWDRRATV